jgi:hypothetical protein
MFWGITFFVLKVASDISDVADEAPIAGGWGLILTLIAAIAGVVFSLIAYIGAKREASTSSSAETLNPPVRLDQQTTVSQPPALGASFTSVDQPGIVSRSPAMGVPPARKTSGSWQTASGVREPSIKLTPPSAEPGAVVRAEAQGFPTGATLALAWRGAAGVQSEIARIRANSTGDAAFTFVVPPDAAPGAYTLELAPARGRSATAVFQVLGSTLATNAVTGSRF